MKRIITRITLTLAALLVTGCASVRDSAALLLYRIEGKELAFYAAPVPPESGICGTGTPVPATIGLHAEWVRVKDQAGPPAGSGIVHPVPATCYARWWKECNAKDCRNEWWDKCAKAEAERAMERSRQ